MQKKLLRHQREGRRETFDPSVVRRVAHFPMLPRWGYVERGWCSRTYRLPQIWPAPDTANVAICTAGPGATNGFEVWATDCIPELHCTANSQIFPRRYLTKNGEWRDNVSPAALERIAKAHPGADVTPDTVFAYVYAALHRPEYWARWRTAIEKGHARIEWRGDFDTTAIIGQELLDLHLGRAPAGTHPLRRTDGRGQESLLGDEAPFTLDGVAWRKTASGSLLRLSRKEGIHLAGFPGANEHRMGQGSLVERVVRGLVNLKERANDDGPKDWADLIGRAVAIGERTAELIRQLEVE